MLNLSRVSNNCFQKFQRFYVFALFLVLYTTSSLGQSSSNVPDITQQQLNPKYWQTKLGNNKGISMKSQEINKFNQQLVATNPHMVDPLATPTTLSKKGLLKKINSISSVPKSARFYADGTQVSAEKFKEYTKALNLNGVKQQNTVAYGLVTARSSLRTFPTLDRVFNRAMDLDLDRFQETAVFPGEAVAILHSSSDGKWLLVQNYHYVAWMLEEDLAFGSKQQIPII